MTDTVITDAVAYPQDEGIGSLSDGGETWNGAGYLAGLAQVVGTSGYVHAGLTFSGHDAANDQFSIDPGRCYVVASNVSVQSTTGGSSPPAYDTTLTADIPVMIGVPSSVSDLAVTDSSLNDVWVAFDTDGTGPGSTGSVYVRHGTGLSTPSHPSVKLGQVNPDDSSADTRANDNAAVTYRSITTGSIDNGGSAIDLGDVLNRLDMSKGSTTHILEAFATNNAGGVYAVQPTDGVSTTATAIFNFPGTAGERSGFLLIQGKEQSTSARFSDIVHTFRTAGTSTVVNSEESGTPAGRTYTIDTGTDTLDLAMASDTYDVVAAGTSLRRD